MKSLPYAWKVVLPFLVLLVVALAVLNIFVSTAINQFSINNWELNLLQQAHLYAADAAPLIQKGEPYAEVQALALSQQSNSNVRVTIILPNGTVIGESAIQLNLLDNHLLRPEIQGALAGRDATEIRTSATLNTEYLYAAVPVYNANQIIGVVRLAIPLDTLQKAIQTIRNVDLGTMLIAVIIGIALAILLTARGVNPLRKLTQDVEQITASEEFSELPANLNRDEIGTLTTSFNKLINTLNQRISNVKSEQATLDAVLSNMSDGAMIIQEDSTVQLINRAAINLFDVHEVPNTNASLIEVIRVHQVYDLWKKCLSSGQVHEITLELLHEKRYIQLIASSLGASMPGATLILAQDLTRLHHLEMVRRDFVSNVSHELRTPLASMKSLTESLQQSVKDDPQNTARFLNLMDDEIDNMTQMVEEFLELAKIESGRVPFMIAPVLPSSFIDPAVERMRLQVERAGLTLNTRFEEALPQVMADSPRIQEVIVNLLHNAIKFTPPGGKIEITARSANKFLEVAISDTGVGIKATDLDRIFERFYKTDKARASGGTGLGLSIARHTVEAHGGRIWVDSVEGEGSTFTFTLPLAQQPEQKKTA